VFVIISAKNFLTRAFPVPKFLLLSNISVSISDGELSFFEFQNSGKKLLPKSYGKIPIPLVRIGSIDEKQKTETLSALNSFAKTQKVSLIHALIHDGDVYVFRLTIPTINREEFRSAIESVLEENVPIPPSEVSFEYSVIHVDEVRGETSVAISVVPDKIIDGYVDLFSQAGLFPVAFETESTAMVKALFSPKEKGISLVLAVKSKHSMIFIVEDGHVVFSSSTDSPSTKSQLLFDEINKILVFWKTQEKKVRDFRDISHIILVGSGLVESDLARQIANSFKLPVIFGSVWTNVLSVEDDVPGLSLKDSQDYGSLIGALLS